MVFVCKAHKKRIFVENQDCSYWKDHLDVMVNNVSKVVNAEVYHAILIDDRYRNRNSFVENNCLKCQSYFVFSSIAYLSSDVHEGFFCFSKKSSDFCFNNLINFLAWVFLMD